MTTSVPSIPLSIIVPVKYDQQEIDQAIRAELIRWQVANEDQQTLWRIENVRFEHNPDWRDAFWSLENARSGNLWVWRFIRVTYVAAALSPYLIRMVW